MRIPIKLTNFPDSKLCRASHAYLTALSAPTMVNHCKRTFLFAAAIADKVGLRPDLEVLYISSLFHDLGLEPGLAEADGDFEDVGGRAAAGFLIAHEAPEKTIEWVRTAIALHTQVSTAENQTPEYALLHMGAMVDVVGARIDHISESDVRQILEEHPRLGCKKLLIDRLDDQKKWKPKSRIASSIEQFNLLKLIEEAPFPE